MELAKLCGHVLWYQFLRKVLFYGVAGTFVMDVVVGCPQDKIGRVIACLTSPAGEHGDSALLSGRDVREMEKYCRNGGSTSMLDCITALFDNCTQSDENELLAKFADRQRLNLTFVRFCENFEVYRSNSRCISDQEQIVHACHEDSKKTLVPLGPVHTVCRNFQTTYECSTGPVTRACGRQTGDVIGNFLRGITPPICQGYDHRDPTSTAHVSNARDSHVIASVTLSVILMHSISKRWQYVQCM
ncbi:uncharacterized protein LOC110449588 [Mizuhopecten yessoensis]|uniref:Uncharacterized protein n=1 Tax=Mizuhopecten yessoensis TaxID=6573 RepID=A0A210QQW2_MIZYE|nr:uncharacterized protein LOC110449588 [Mizuhopecten yessoensis]OWF51130.1 hypothetical protein KP79_PYT11511 [Mizuhopecten yessoensis]